MNIVEAIEFVSNHHLSTLKHSTNIGYQLFFKRLKAFFEGRAVLASDGTGGWRALPETTPEQIRPGLLIYRFAHTMYYANAEQLSREVADLAEGAEPPLVWFCIDASAVADVDFSASLTLREICGNLKEQGIRLVLADVVDPVKAELDRYELTDLMGKDAFYQTISAVVSAYGELGTAQGA